MIKICSKPEWICFKEEEHDAIQETIDIVRSELAYTGLKTRSHRFPFAMHHTYYRDFILVGGKKARHSDVSALLMQWASIIPGDLTHRYVGQATFGALQPLKPTEVNTLPDSVRSMIEKARSGLDFEEWLRAYGAFSKSSSSN